MADVCSVAGCGRRPRVNAAGSYDFGAEKGWMDLRLCDVHAGLLDGKYLTVTMRDEDFDSPRFDPDDE